MCKRNRHIDGSELFLGLYRTEPYFELACETVSADSMAWDVFML